MSSAELRGGEGRFELVGELSFETVPDLLARSEPLLGAGPAIEIGLAGVSRADSAGLALLIEWLRRARARNQAISLVGMPRQMRDIVRISGLDEVLPFASE